MSQEDQAIPQLEQLLVVHAKGESRYDTRNFTVDDKSAVLLVFSNEHDPKRRRTLAAFNREFWVHASFVPALAPVEVDDNAAG